jgi:hypothetical protein
MPIIFKAMKTSKLRHYLLIVILIPSFTLTSSSQQNLNFDLYKLTLNGLKIQELTIDKVTDLLGRPSATNSLQPISEILGPQIIYHTKGLMFWFKSKNDDPKQRLFLISIHLVKAWDKDYNEFFMPFPGNINPKLTPNQKVNTVPPLFKNYTVTIQSAEERRKEVDQALGGMNINTKSQHDIVRITNGSTSINVMGEEVTKFLEFISLIFE